MALQNLTATNSAPGSANTSASVDVDASGSASVGIHVLEVLCPRGGITVDAVSWIEKIRR